MHHLYPLAKGDPLCPLGFHPQVRWPTRCKRCFRDYKEHGGKRREESSSTSLKKTDTTSSTPSLSTWNSGGGETTRSWYSSSNLALEKDNKTNSISSKEFSNPSSWESTPDLSTLNDDTQANIPTVHFTLPKRKAKPIVAEHRTVSDSFSIRQDKSATVNRDLFSKNDSLATRAKKLQAIKDINSFDKSKRIHIKEIKTITEDTSNSTDHDVKKAPVKQSSKESSEEDDDNISSAGTETTDTTLVDDEYDSEYKDRMQNLKKELEAMKKKCERLEKEKSNILLRRLISMDSSSSKTSSADLLKLQQKCNEIQSQLDDYKDEKKILTLRVKELEEEMESRPTAQQAQKIADELRSKLLAAETLCEELMDENEDMKKEMRDLEEEMEEMQDNFREDQADEYTSLKKELEQTTKNCRILSFKLRKTERKVEQLETEKNEAEKKSNTSIGQSGVNYVEKIKSLEKELNAANEKADALQKELQEHKIKSTAKKKAPMLGSIGRLSSDGKVSRESLTRGGSQEDPVQLLRDLQDSLEREADLREQLKFAEGEAQNLRKKASRIEDDNESLVMQLKKMATKARSRKLSPTNNNRLAVNSSTEKDEGISDDEDVSEIKLQLELSEQEAAVLRKKVEELEGENERIKKKSKDLQDKLAAAKPRKSLFSSDKDNEKIKALEEDLIQAKKNLNEKEKECDRLLGEINSNKKLQKTKSVDLDQHTLDLKRQLEVVEQEASVLRTRVQNYDNENEKLLQENKRLQLTRSNSKNAKADKVVLDKYIDQIATLEIQLDEANMKIKELEEKNANSDNVENLKLKLIENERDNLANTLTKLKQDSSKAFRDRIVKRPSELTSKSQLKTMVNELENEISEILVVLSNSEKAKEKLEKEMMQELKTSGGNRENESILKSNLDDLKNKLSSMEKEIKLEKSNLNKEKQRNDDLTKKLQKSKDSMTAVTEEKDKMKNEINKYKSSYEKVLEDKNTLKDELAKVKKELDTANAADDDFKKKWKVDLENKIKELTNMKNELNGKTKDLEITSKKLENLEKEYKDVQEKQISCEKAKKVVIKQLENKIDEERTKNKLKETEQTELSDKLKADNNKLNAQIEDLNNNILCLESTVKSKNMLIQKLEESLQKEKIDNTTKNKTEAKQINELREEIAKYKSEMNETQKTLESSTASKKNLEEKLKKSESDYKADKIKLEKSMADLEIDLQNEKKKIDVLKANYDKESKNRELELGILRNKIKSLEANSGMGTKKMAEIKREYQEQIDKLESQLAKEKKKYSELTAKYEILEEEHVVTKAKLVAEIDSVNNQSSSVRREMEVLEGELQTVRDTYNTKQDAWIKEKLQIQEKLKEYERLPKNGNDLEKSRLKSLLGEAQSDLEQLKKECDVANDQMDYMRRENDELRKKLDDFDKVSKIQRNISADSTAMDKEIKELKIRLDNSDKSKKCEIAEYKLRYENQIQVINEELRLLQSQVSRFKRERDTYKHMLEGAQKTITDLKTGPKIKTTKDSQNVPSTFDEIEEYRNKVATLEQQISCMEDELSEARLEGSKLKTELISERSTYDVKLSELHSRVNELEEEKILSSGRTKIAGLRTRMELAWQKEREEQQRLLQETATLARDLRQTLYEVERERDKEKLEAKRKIDQLKKTAEEEQEETKRKLTELQCDLLELRDAHAKLRTTNEKLRREKERQGKEREEMKNIIHGRRKNDQQDDRKVNALIEQIDTLMQIIPDLYGNEETPASPYTPTPPRRTKGPKSRESSPAIDSRGSKESSVVRDDKQQQFKTTLHRLIEAADELKRFQRLGEEDRERERLKRSMGMRRATSTEHDNTETNTRTRNYGKNGNVTTNLHRRSLSLEQTSILHEQSIWKGDTDDSVSSMQSLESDGDLRYGKRDVSLDSRLSGGSTQSEATAHDKKKKKSLMAKLKKFTKSRSIDDQDPGTFSSTEGLSSKPNLNTDVNEDPRGSKRDLKDRLAGMFKRSGSSSRSNSLERQIKQKDNTPSSTQRPLMRTDSNTNLSSSSSTKTDAKRNKRV